jgi:hypothetical protein
MRLRIAESEGDHASSQNIADLIGRTGACGRVQARDDALCEFGTASRRECAADSPIFWASNICPNGAVPPTGVAANKHRKKCREKLDVDVKAFIKKTGLDEHTPACADCDRSRAARLDGCKRTFTFSSTVSRCYELNPG